MTYELYGDGVHDDYPAIQSLLDSGISEGVLPPTKKYYVISKTLKIHRGQTLRLGLTTRIRLSANANCAMIENDFTQWNEWEDVNVDLKPYKNIQLAESPAVTSIELGQTDIDFTCDDFNIQDDYVGQGVQAMLELDVETAGLLDSDTRSIF